MHYIWLAKMEDDTIFIITLIVVLTVVIGYLVLGKDDTIRLDEQPQNEPLNDAEFRKNLLDRIDKTNDLLKRTIHKVIDDVLNTSSKFEHNKNILEQSFQSPLKEARESFEKQYLISQLKKFSGNISKTAKFIGMERSALHRKLKLLGVKDLN